MSKKKKKKRSKGVVSITLGILTLIVVVLFTYKMIEEVKVLEQDKKGSNYVVKGKQYTSKGLTYKIEGIEEIKGKIKGVVVGDGESEDIKIAVTYKLRNDTDGDLTAQDKYYLKMHNEVRTTNYSKEATRDYLQGVIKKGEPNVDVLKRGNEYTLTQVYIVNKKRYYEGKVTGFVNGTHFYLK